MSLSSLVNVEMKRSRLGISMRRDKIVQILKMKGFMLTSELSNQLDVSPPTIQKDLEFMERTGQVELWGEGAILLTDENGSTLSADIMTCKHAIAKRAAQHVERGDTIFVNSSYTALLILPYIEARNVTVITNNARAVSIKRKDDITLILTGGEVCPPTDVLLGEFALDAMEKISVSKSFLGCSGITAQKGITTAILQESAINDMILTRTSGKRFILADRTKIGRISNYTCGSCDRLSCLITDSMAPKKELKKLRRHIEVIQVKMPEQNNLRLDSIEE
jgi:DeoR/GlpR family transcriptional regulator of sugar metabolism